MPGILSLNENEFQLMIASSNSLATNGQSEIIQNNFFFLLILTFRFNLLYINQTVYRTLNSLNIIDDHLFFESYPFYFQYSFSYSYHILK